MTTPDWADEEAGKWRDIYLDPETAPSLRAAYMRGRVAGLREAVEIAKELLGSGFICDAIRAAADKVEGS